MSKVRVINYTFDASAKQVTFTDINPIILEGVLLIVNVTDNIIIYNFADAALGGTAATNVLTLDYNTATMDDSDKLLIYYDEPVQITAINVALASVPSHPVTNAGTFAVQAVLGAETTKVIGTINIAAAQTIAVTNADITSIKTAVELLDNSVDGNYLNTNMNIAGVDVSSGAGVVGTGVQRITHASDDPVTVSLAALDNAVDGNYLNVNINLAGTDAPSGNGTAATSLRVTIASDSTGQVKLASNTGVDVGDVDILSVIPGVGATNLGKAIDSAVGATDTGAMALAVRDDTLNARSGAENDYEPLHTNANGALWSIDVNSAAMLTALQLIDNMISGNEAQVDVITMPTITVNAHAITIASGGVASGALAAGSIAAGAAVSGAFVDGAIATLGAKADAKSTATDATAITVMQVLKQISASVQAPPSRAVTNAGAFAVQATLGAASGVDIGKLTANQSVNNSQINGVTPLMGNGVTGTGSQRVTIASDNTAFSVNATLAAETTKVIGTVNIAAAQAVTANLSATDNAVLDAIEADTTIIAGAVAATHMQCDIVGALPAGTAAIGKLAANSGVDIGDVDILSIAAGDNNIGNVDVATLPGSSELIFRSIDLDESEEEVKATAALLYGWYIFNAAAVTQYVKLYNLTAANTTVGTSTPVMTIPVPAGAAANVEFTNGIAFATALTAAATTGVADADTGAPAANSLIINLFYK